jgi:hypothetical protein
VELIQAEVEILRPEIYKLTNSIWKICLFSGRSLLLYHYTKSGIKPTVLIIVRYHSYQLHTDCIQCPSVKVKSVHR